jgi:hypothetical protein
MQEKKNPSKIPAKRGGRPKKSPLTPREQARIRKMRQRAKLADSHVAKIEILLPAPFKAQIKKAAGVKSFSEIGEEAFRLWLELKHK